MDSQGAIDTPVDNPHVAAEAVRTPILRRAPLVGVAAAMVAGIAVGRYVPAPVGVWGAGGAIALLAAVATLRWDHLRIITVCGIFAGIGLAAAAGGALAYRRIETGHIATYSGDGEVMATVRGEIVSAPRFHEASGAYWMPPKTTFLLRASGIRRTDGEWLDTTGLVRVAVAEPVDDIVAGEEIELVGSLGRFRRPSNPGQYDWAAANHAKGVFVRFRVPGRDGVTKLAGAAANPLADLWRRARTLSRRHIAASGGREDAALLQALVLGERDPALRELNQAMAEAGVAHFLSISGLHLGIFLGFIYWLGRLAMFPPRRSAAMVLIVLAAYLLLAEPRPPLLRGALMAAALCVAVMAGRSVSVANVLAAAAIILLCIDPLQLFTPGFQLSFAIVAGIIVIREPIRRVLFGRYLRRRGLMVFRGDQRVRRWLHYRAANGAIHLICLSLAAYISAAPLVAHHFGLFSPYAPLLSILLLPVMVAVLVPAYVSMALAILTPNLAWQVGRLAALAGGAMQWLVMQLGRLPGLSFDVRPTPAWLIGGAYLCLALWALGRRRRWALAGAAATTAAVIVVTVITQLPAAAPPHGQLHVLDVGHGSMTLLHSPAGRTYLFDAGTLGSGDSYQQVLRPFLRAKRLPAPEAVFISHANVDHYNALWGLLDRSPPRRAYVYDTFGECEDEPPSARKLIERMKQRGVEVVRVHAGRTIELDPDTRVEVLWPGAQAPEGADPNDRSLVLRLTCRARSVILPGDAGEIVESALTGGNVKADVLILPHHGSATPTLGAFIAAADPSMLVQSNSYRSESPKLLTAIAGRPRYATHRHGWIRLDLADDAVTAETMRGEQTANPKSEFLNPKQTSNSKSK